MWIWIGGKTEDGGCDYTTPATERDAAFIENYMTELHRAREKFPVSENMCAVIGEEFGEVCRAQLQGNNSELRRECVHVAVTAHRLATEGDRRCGDMQGLK